MAWGDEMKGNWISLKVGETAEFTIKEIKKVTDNPDYHFKKKDGSNLGYHYEFITDKGNLTVGSFGLFFALKNAMADVGLKVKVTHPERGKYTAELLGGTPVKNEEPDDVNLSADQEELQF